jgi:hypothetical protein
VSDAESCALWYWRHHVCHYELHDNEEEAAAAAYSMEEWGEGVPVGLQFPDGRVIPTNEWTVYREYGQRRRAAEDAEYAALHVEPPRPTRRILDPFDGQSVVIDADAPQWLGKRS